MNRMKRLLAAATLLAASVTLTATAATEDIPMLTGRDIQSVAPALEHFTRDTLLADVWARPQLSRRDRSIVTVSALIARNQTIELPYYLNLALDNGVKPAELSEIITHLAFYAGWANAMSAVAVTRPIFAERRIGQDQLPAASVDLLPLDEAAEAQRAASVEQSTGPVSPGLVKYTGETLFNDLWLRPDLAPRDRSLVTVSALIANSKVEQMPFHLGKAMDNGMTQQEAGEVISHLAFYAGWPNAFSAIPVARGVFESRVQ